MISIARLLYGVLGLTVVFWGQATASAETAAPSLIGVAPKVTAVLGVGGINQTISVEVQGLKPWIDAGNSPQKLVLFLDGRGLADVRADLAESEYRSLRFDLRRSSDAKAREVWASLLGKPDGFERIFAVSVGPESGPPFASEVTADPKKGLRFLLIRPTLFWVFLALFGIVFVLFVRLAERSDLLRDIGPQPAAARKPFSLARVQMAFWFFLVLGSFALIWLVTGDRGNIPASVLALIGISAGTALGAAAVDSSNAAAAAAGGAPAGQSSRGFFLDVLSEANGVDFHRFQIFVWTLTLGIIFLASVYNGLAMPSFDDTLLGLMGLSGGTYVGFKLAK